MVETKKRMVLDCETATMAFAEAIAKGDASIKKRIAIAKPLIYDIGWAIVDRLGRITKKVNFLVAETFCVPSIFDTAYYAEKRPKYLEMLANGEITIKPWNEIAEILIADMKTVEAVGAFNSMFDFKKAIPFTDLYIKKLYSPDYYDWEKVQRVIAEKIGRNEIKRKDEDNDFDPDHFVFRGETYDLFDIWGLATSYLLNTATYKKQCVEHNLFTASGVYFKTSAESTYQYLKDKYDFIESHTALDDAIIESFILSRITSHHALEMGIKYFPFKDLGETVDFAMRRKRPNLDECQKVYDAISAYIDGKDESNYITKLTNKLDRLAAYMGRA